MSLKRIAIKPLSVNEAWQGKRFKTDAYKHFEYYVLLLLKKQAVPPGELTLHLNWGFSNYASSDTDNPIKPFVDCLQKKFGFNDNKIKQMIIEKFRVAKGDEYIEFELVPYK